VAYSSFYQTLLPEHVHFPMECLESNFLNPLGHRCLDFTTMHVRMFSPQEQAFSEEIHGIVNRILGAVGQILTYCAVTMHVTLDEVKYAIILIERMLTGAQELPMFVLTEGNTPMVVLIALMIVMKGITADTTYSNQYWSRAFRIELASLDSSEVFMLKKLDWKCRIDDDDIIAINLFWLRLSEWGNSRTIVSSLPCS
jgi:hypothetical protein